MQSPIQGRNKHDDRAGVCSIRLAGFAGGNIDSSGTRSLCAHHCATFEEILRVIR